MGPGPALLSLPFPVCVQARAYAHDVRKRVTIKPQKAAYVIRKHSCASLQILLPQHDCIAQTSAAVIICLWDLQLLLLRFAIAFAHLLLRSAAVSAISPSVDHCCPPTLRR